MKKKSAFLKKNRERGNIRREGKNARRGRIESQGKIFKRCAILLDPLPG
jgi:hypothetical protein